jgi:hypothetical protein
LRFRLGCSLKAVDVAAEVVKVVELHRQRPERRRVHVARPR